LSNVIKYPNRLPSNAIQIIPITKNQPVAQKMSMASVALTVQCSSGLADCVSLAMLGLEAVVLIGVVRIEGVGTPKRLALGDAALVPVLRALSARRE
jgi:hypothetical protein